MSRETYSAVLERSGDGGWGVTFPLFPGCVSYGRNQREAQANATEALELHIAGMVEDLQEVPFEEGDEDEGIRHATGTSGDRLPIFVTVEIGDSAGERVNVYLPKSLVRWVDLYASRRGMNRSSVFSAAVKRFLEGALAR